MMIKKIVSIHGVPRSGTSWLGQIINSHSAVAFRFQPLFAYRFKDKIDIHSNSNEINTFLEELYNVTDDDFILNKKEIAQEIYPAFKKDSSPDLLVMKMVRYHHLVEKLLKEIDQIKIIGIVRNPCAVINSWFKAPREFNKEWDPLEEWRYATKKNKGRPEEFYGFEKWKVVASMFLDFKKRFPQKFYLVRYEDLVNGPYKETKLLFDFIGLEIQDQVSEFIMNSQASYNDNPYSVFKRPDVKDRWKFELNPFITKKIINELSGTKLGSFLS